VDEDDGDPLSSSLAFMLFDDDEDDIIAAAMVLSRFDGGNVRRNRKQEWRHTRIVWHAHVVQLHHEYLFERTYRMSHIAFTKLQDLLEDRIQLNTQNTPVVDPIPVQIVMASGLRWLAGCPCLDIHISMGIRLPSVYRFRDIFLVAVNSTPELNLVFPQTNAEIRKASQDFRT
jgi:hypothetical protein